MRNPNGAELLKTLIALYAEQEGVRITHQLEVGNEAT